MNGTTNNDNTIDDVTNQLTFLKVGAVSSSSTDTCCRPRPPSNLPPASSSSNTKSNLISTNTNTNTTQKYDNNYNGGDIESNQIQSSSSSSSPPPTATTRMLPTTNNNNNNNNNKTKNPKRFTTTNSNNNNNNNNNNFYDSIPLSVQPNMNETSNVLMHYTLNDMKQRADTNFWLGLICLAVCAINIVLLGLNYTLHKDYNNDNNHLSTSTSTTELSLPPNVSHRTFHLIEFWTSHIYAITEAYALITSPKTMMTIYSKPNLLKLLLFFNVVNSLVPALLITLDTEYFEKISHQLEYINEFTLSFITLILLGSLLNLSSSTTTNTTTTNTNTTSTVNKKNDNNDNGTITTNNDDNNNTNTSSSSSSSILTGTLACAIALINLGLYNWSRAEYAHYLEFTFNVSTAMITFWFCLDNRFVAQLEIGQILYGQHQNCSFCQKRSSAYLIEQQQAAAANYFNYNNNNNMTTAATTTTTTTTTNSGSSNRQRWSSLFGTMDNNNNNSNNNDFYDDKDDGEEQEDEEARILATSSLLSPSSSSSSK